MLPASICMRAIVIEFLEDSKFKLTSQDIALPSSDLCYEYSVLKSDHCPNVSRVFQWFRSVISHCVPGEGPGKIREMIDVFRQFSDEMCMSLREYILTEGIVETCFRMHVEDNDLVCEVLNLMYECWASFGSFHFSAILRPNHFRQFYTRPHHKSRSTDFLTYFLEHARRNKLEYDRTRMIDVSVYSSTSKSPAFVAADVWCWKPLLKYLQYGARFEYVTVDPTTTRNGVHSALTDTFRNLIRHLCIRLVRPAVRQGLTRADQIQDYCGNLAPELRDLCRTMSVVLRAVGRLRSDVLDFVIRDPHSDPWMVHLTSPRAVLKHPTVDLMLPTLKERCGAPVGLQHTCRWVIRNCLNENWQLPTGIKRLPIPPMMKRYINLLSD